MDRLSSRIENTESTRGDYIEIVPDLDYSCVPIEYSFSFICDLSAVSIENLSALAISILRAVMITILSAVSIAILCCETFGLSLLSF